MPIKQVPKAVPQNIPKQEQIYKTDNSLIIFMASNLKYIYERIPLSILLSMSK